jgi:hypothetical protein
MRQVLPLGEDRSRLTLAADASGLIQVCALLIVQATSLFRQGPPGSGPLSGIRSANLNTATRLTVGPWILSRDVGFAHRQLRFNKLIPIAAEALLGHVVHTRSATQVPVVLDEEFGKRFTDLLLVRITRSRGLAFDIVG